LTITCNRRAAWDSQRTSAVYAFIAAYQLKHGYGPSLREIAVGVGLNTAQSVLHHVELLAGRGRVTRTPGIARSIRVVEA
jgi:SOS-response transcriptional repressor LexA